MRVLDDSNELQCLNWREHFDGAICDLRTSIASTKPELLRIGRGRVLRLVVVELAPDVAFGLDD